MNNNSYRDLVRIRGTACYRHSKNEEEIRDPWILSRNCHFPFSEARRKLKNTNDNYQGLIYAEKLRAQHQ